MVSGFVIFAAGAIGMQAINYLYLGDYKRTYLYTLEIVFEEFFEMIGASIVLTGALMCSLQNSHGHTATNSPDSYNSPG
jgi:hypothetical protein